MNGAIQVHRERAWGRISVGQDALVLAQWRHGRPRQIGMTTDGLSTAETLMKMKPKIHGEKRLGTKSNVCNHCQHLFVYGQEQTLKTEQTTAVNDCLLN